MFFGAEEDNGKSDKKEFANSANVTATKIGSIKTPETALKTTIQDCPNKAIIIKINISVREPCLPKKVQIFKQFFPIHLARRQLELVGRRVYVVKDLIRPPQRPAGLPDAQEGDVQTVTGYVLLDLTRQRKRKLLTYFPAKQHQKGSFLSSPR